MHTARDAADRAVETETAKAKEIAAVSEANGSRGGGGGGGGGGGRLTTAPKTKTQAENTRAAFEKLDTRMNAASTPRQVISAARSAADALIDKRVIDKDRYRELLLQIQDVEKKETNHTRMATLVRQAIIAAAIAGAGAAGMGGYELGHYISHRINPR